MVPPFAPSFEARRGCARLSSTGRSPAPQRGLAIRVGIAAVSATIALLVPPVLLVDGVRVLANDWYVRHEYGKRGFPRDPYGLTREQRTGLALIGLHSIQPENRQGIDLLRAARLPDGSPAFNARELRHMTDVRGLIGALYLLHLAGLAAIAGLAAVLAFSRRARGLVPRALMRGALLTLVLAALTLLLTLTDFAVFSGGFHGLFFGGDSWRFADTDTLRRLYPDPFWSDTAMLLGLATVGQAAVLLAVAWLWTRKAKPSS